MDSDEKHRAQYRIHHHEFITDDEHVKRNMQRTRAVVILTLAMVLLEITFGFLSSSMALMAEGWHMASHVGALTITLFAYRFATSRKVSENFSFGSGKFIPLGGYTTAVVLAIIAILMAWESVQRLFVPEKIIFGEAILITGIGLLVNIASAILLGHGNHLNGHSHSEHDHNHDCNHDHDDAHSHDHSEHSHAHATADVNIRSAYFHILADAFTPVLALGALLLSRRLNATWPDAVVGLIGSAIMPTLWVKINRNDPQIRRFLYLHPFSGPFKRFKRPKEFVTLSKYQGRLTSGRIMEERILNPLKILSAWSSISLCNLKTKTSDQPFKRSTQRVQVCGFLSCLSS